MVNPLNITASIIAVVQITSKVIFIYYNYRCGLKKSQKACRNSQTRLLVYEMSWND